uniref:Bestrophin homolog n=1 Tax=Steinernema glaseri TaxID=37863 RepID=A0A1I7YGW8_9BILA
MAVESLIRKLFPFYWLYMILDESISEYMHLVPVCALLLLALLAALVFAAYFTNRERLEELRVYRLHFFFTKMANANRAFVGPEAMAQMQAARNMAMPPPSYEQTAV